MCIRDSSGRILRLFNCNDRGFLLLREAPKPKFLPEIFVFALLKTVQNQAARNSGRILRLINCNDWGFLQLREVPKPKFLPENVCVYALENCPKPS